MKFDLEKSKEMLAQTLSTLKIMLSSLSGEWINNIEGGWRFGQEIQS